MKKGRGISFNNLGTNMDFQEISSSDQQLKYIFFLWVS